MQIREPLETLKNLRKQKLYLEIYQIKYFL
ncbi:hypothetical protein HMPREF9466_02911 [Fusobacterium necrophorum subsp. funduliforme 1_1_36S]|nr:hypothetical protein HMPREF9466_02911 [Fusobacterium necrophorum subsp. funduliforme 1_1_36S]